VVTSSPNKAPHKHVISCSLTSFFEQPIIRPFTNPFLLDPCEFQSAGMYLLEVTSCKTAYWYLPDSASSVSWP